MLCPFVVMQPQGTTGEIKIGSEWNGTPALVLPSPIKASSEFHHDDCSVQTL
jgi:hypothetical protein